MKKEDNKTAISKTADTDQSDKNKNTDTANVDEAVTTPLEKFFTDSLKDIYWAEKALLEALPKMQQAATTEELQDAIEDHTLQTSKHISRLEKVFTLLGKPAEAVKCEVMEALIKEGQKTIASTAAGSMTRDAALIIAAQKVEHYEIASYGGLVQLALTLGLGKVAELLERTLAEEEDTDALLTEIGESSVNFAAEEETQEDIEDIMP